MVVAISAAVQSLYPPSALVTVTGLTLTDSATIYRSAGGVRAPVRAGAVASATDPSLVRTDGELPFGTPVTYSVTVNSLADYTATAITATLPGGKAVLSDAITGAAAEVVILGWEEKGYARQASTFKVGGRNVVVSGDLGMFEATIELFTEAFTSSENLRELLAGATDGIVLLRGPSPTYPGVDCYVVPTDATERRFSQDGSDGRRTWVLQVAEVAPWAADLEASAFTYQDLADFYGLGTYADLGNFIPNTYLAVAQGDFV